MQENLPHIDDPQIREGFAEFVAWLYAKTEKLDRVPWRIEQNTDPVYGDGFRRVRDLMGDDFRQEYPWETQEKEIKSDGEH